MAKRRENLNKKLRQRWAVEISGWQSSGKSQKKYCEDRGISFWNFKYWVSVLKKETVSALVPVQVCKDYPPIPQEEHCLIECGNLRISIISKEALTQLPKLLKVLR